MGFINAAAPDVDIAATGVDAAEETAHAAGGMSLVAATDVDAAAPDVAVEREMSMPAPDVPVEPRDVDAAVPDLAVAAAEVRALALESRPNWR